MLGQYTQQPDLYPDALAEREACRKLTQSGGNWKVGEYRHLSLDYRTHAEDSVRQTGRY